jgi:sporulation protein YlmC with PRC-barrel domain
MQTGSGVDSASRYTSNYAPDTDDLYLQSGDGIICASNGLTQSDTISYYNDGSALILNFSNYTGQIVNLTFAGFMFYLQASRTKNMSLASGNACTVAGTPTILNSSIYTILNTGTLISYQFTVDASNPYIRFFHSTAGSDTSNSFAFDYYIINVTSTAPVVTLISPVNNASSTSATQYFISNFTTAANLVNSTFYIWNSTNSIINTTNSIISGTSNQTNISIILPYGDNFKWNYYLCDNSSTCVWGSSNWTIRYDLTPPIINIIYPLNNTSYSFNISAINYTYSDLNPGSCWYSNSSGIWNSTTQTSGNNFTNVATIDGSNTLTLYCNDSSGNANSTSVTFTKAIPKIGLTLISPTGNINATQNQTFQVQVNVSCSGGNCGEINVTLDPASNTFYNFTTCGASGRIGPTQTNCTTNYTGTTLAGLVGVDSTGIQNWTVPSGVTSITITAKGASGGYVSGYTPGYGTLMTGTFAVTPGQIIFILVGQTPGLTSAYAGGGGGTFVATGNNYSNSSVLIVAGGGGGAYSATGINASVGINGTGSSPGTNGNGAPASSCGGGGGGFNSSGANDTGYGGDVHAGGIGFKQGGAGGSNKAESSYQSGGFGGGAVANWHGDCYNRGGAGGGYSGGSGFGPGSGNSAAYGQAGGSYNGGTSQNNNVSRVYGNGYVIITAYGGGKGGTVSMNTSATPFYTTTQNPYNLTLNQGESQVITWNVNATGTINQSYTFFVYANLTSDLSIGNITNQWNVTITNETAGISPPSVSVSYPQNANYTTNVSDLNYTVSGTNLSSCWYSLNGGANSTYSPFGTNFTGLASSEGSNTWIVYCNNTNLTGSGSVTFYKDTILPNVTLNFPSDSYTNSTTNTINITFNCSAADNLVLKNISLYLTNSSNNNFSFNRSANITGTSNNTNWTLSLGPGNYTWNCLASDSLGNSNWSTNKSIGISFIDATYPQFSNFGFNYTNASIYTSGRGYSANSTITNTNGTAGIEFNSVNYTATNVSSLFTSTIGQLSAGTYSYYWWAYGNGTNRNYNTTSVYYFTINQSTGNVSGFINNSANNFTAWNGTSSTNIWLNATNITGYGTGKIYLNGSIINSGTMPLSNLTNLSVGYYNVTFVYDGNTNYTSNTKVLLVNVSVYVDTIYPVFSNYWDNNATLTGNGTAIFNVTITNTNRSVFLEINGTNYTANNISASVWNYSLFLVNGTYSYRWWAYGNGTSNNLNNSGLRSYTIINPDLVPPAITIISPANTTYNENIIYFNLSSNENLSLCKLTINNWATNYTMTINSSRTGANYTSGELSDGSYVARFWCNDTSNNINNSETVTFVLNASAVIINSFSIYPYSAINGSNIYIYTSVTKAQGIFANITLPNGTINLVTLTNNSNTSFSSTNLIGRYNITIFGNNSLGGFASSSDYFETFLPLLFNLSITNSNSTGINTSWNIYYRNNIIASNSSSDGVILNNFPDSLVNIEFKAYSENISLLLRNVNLSKETNKTFGIDYLSVPPPGYILTYGINNSFNFTNATLKINYSQTSYTNESYLGLYKCNDWDFSNQICSGSWTDVTSDSTQDRPGDLFEYLTTSFSGFSIKQEEYCGDSSCNNDETCSSCSSDCGVCSNPPSGGGGGGSMTIKYECEREGDCNSSYTCYNHKCVKLFDVEILKVEPLIDSGNFSLYYLIKGMANFSGDVIIKYWIENPDKKVMLGQDVVYFGSFEEKRRTAELNLPINTINGDYDLYVQASFENYRAESFRKINLNNLKEVLHQEGAEQISLSPRESHFWKNLFFILFVSLMVLFLSLKRYRKSTFYYFGKAREEAAIIEHDYLERTKEYMGKMGVHAVFIFKEFFNFIYNFFRKLFIRSDYTKIGLGNLIIVWLNKTKFEFGMLWHYIERLYHYEIGQIKRDLCNNMDFVIKSNSIRVFQIGIIKKLRYIKNKCCIGSLTNKMVYTVGGHFLGNITQPILDLNNKKILGWLIKPRKRFGIGDQVLIPQKEFVAIGDIVFATSGVLHYLHSLSNFCQIHPNSKNKVCHPINSSIIKNTLVRPPVKRRGVITTKIIDFCKKFLKKFKT